MIASPLPSRVLNLFVASEDGSCRNFHCFRNESLSQQRLPCSTVVRTDVRAPTEIDLGVHFTVTNVEVSRLVSISNYKMVVPRLRRSAKPHQQQSFADSRKRVQRWTVVVQTKNRCEPARLNTRSSPSPCRTQSAPFIFQVL